MRAESEAVEALDADAELREYLGSSPHLAPALEAYERFWRVLDECDARMRAAHGAPRRAASLRVVDRWPQRPGEE